MTVGLDKEKTATYKLYTYPGSNKSAGKYYLCAYKDQVYADRSCEAYTTTQITQNGLTGYDEWRFFTYEQIYTLQKENADKMNKSLELSFKLKAPGFERGNKEITAWKTYSFMPNESSQWRFGLENCYNTAIKVVKDDNYDVISFKKDESFTYTFGGSTYKTKNDYLRDLARWRGFDAQHQVLDGLQDDSLARGSMCVPVSSFRMGCHFEGFSPQDRIDGTS